MQLFEMHGAVRVNLILIIVLNLLNSIKYKY